VTRLAAVVTLSLLIAIIVSLAMGAWPSIREFGLPFLWTAEWDPVQNKFGGLVMIYGTIATSIIALLIAVPVSFGIALFLTELSPKWLKRPLGTAIELLAANSVDCLRHVGSVRVRANPRALRPAAFANRVWHDALCWRPCVRAPGRDRILSAGIILAIMIISVHSRL
jgi:phosphate transport system permease protein